MTRVSLTKLTLGLSLALTLVVARAASADDKDKCTVATSGDSPVAKACAKGGRPEAKKLMKDAVKTAKANGKTFTCEGCHKDLETFALTPNAKEDFPKLMAAQKK
jgi:hypothetical protein